MRLRRFLQKWLDYHLAEVERRLEQDVSRAPRAKLELPPLDKSSGKPRHGPLAAILFLSLLFSPAWGAVVGYLTFDRLYDHDRAGPIGLAVGMTFVPALVYIAILLFGGVLLLLREDRLGESTGLPTTERFDPGITWWENGHRVDSSNGTCACGTRAVLACDNGHPLGQDIDQRPNHCPECGVAYPWAAVTAKVNNS